MSVHKLWARGLKCNLGKSWNIQLISSFNFSEESFSQKKFSFPIFYVKLIFNLIEELRHSHSMEISRFFCDSILREISFRESRRSKSTIFAILRFLNFATLVNFSFQKVQKFIKNQNSEPLKKKILQLLESQKLISRKIWVIEKSQNFHTVLWNQFWLIKWFLTYWIIDVSHFLDPIINLHV